MTGVSGSVKRVAVAAALALLAALAITAVTMRAEKSPDAYLWFDEIDTLDGHDVKMVNGVPQLRFNGEWERHPVAVAQWGLERHAKGDDDALLTAADWFVENQQADGTWLYGFDWHVHSADADLAAPWASAMAQGQVLSVLVRAWRLTDDERYLEIGREALRPLDVLVADGGLRREWRGHVWFEEYPTAEPSLVLNGFLFALFGLREFADAGDPDAERLWEEGEASLSQLGSEFSLGSGDSAYALAFRDRDVEPEVVRGGIYAEIHVDQMREMYALTERQVYADLSEEWADAVPPPRWPVTLAMAVVAAALLGGYVLMVRRRRLAAAA